MKYVRLSLLGVVFFGSFFFLTGCSWKKTTTVSTSDATVVKPAKPAATLSELDDENLFPVGAQGTKQLSFSGTNVNVQDDGMREVFVDDGTTGNLSDEVFTRLTTPGDPATMTGISLKQATVSVGGSMITIPDGAVLLPHLSGYNISISTSGTDLVLQANLLTPPYESYLLFDASLPENYLITNPRDWFGPSLYMIPEGVPSLLKFTRGSDLQGVTLWYATGDTSTSIGYGYEDRRAGNFTLQEEVVVPEGVSVQLTSAFPSSQAKVYHLIFDENKKVDDTQLKTARFPRGKDHLRNFASQKGFGISSFDEVTRSTSGDWVITMGAAKEQAIFVEESSFSYLLPLHNYPFLVELQQDASDDYRPYYSRFLTTYLLDEESVKKTLDTFFGEKNATYQPRDKGFSYQIQPQETYSGTLTVKNIYGQIAQVKANYRIETMKPGAIVQEIVSNNTISILPRGGVFKDVLIQYKNIEKFPVQFQACTINTNPDMLSTYKGVGVENYLFDCAGPLVAQEVRPSDDESFVYRKAYRTPLPIPESLSGASAFKVFFKDQKGQEQAHYMLKSDIGLWTKIADDQLRVWGFTFADGSPLDAGEVKVTSLDGMTIGTATIKDGLAKISLPKQVDAYEYAIQRKKDTYLVQVKTAKEQAFVMAHRTGRGDLSVPAPSPNNSDRYLKFNSKLDISEVTASSNQINQRGMIDPRKIYGYTDRGLYKAGDTINIAGWVRNVLRFDNLDYLEGRTVSVTLSNPMGGDPVLLADLPLDSFGGFAGSYTLPATVPLGNWMVDYRVSDDVAYYSHNIKVEEYQKPTFFVDTTYERNKDAVSLVMQPTYFFGAPLQKYDLQVTWSLVGKDICRYCRRWNENDYYFNHVFNESISTGGSFTLYNQTAERLVQPLYPSSLQIQKGYAYSLKADLIVKDRLSNETQFITKYIDFPPEVKIGLGGQPYEWLYRDGKTLDPRANWKVDGVLQEGKELVKKLTYEVYTWNYDTQLQQGVDGNVYYVNGQSYLTVVSGSLPVANVFTLSGAWVTTPGEYFIRIMAQNEAGETLGEVQKRLSRYVSEDEQDDLLGAVPNNYTLTVDIPKKTYTEGEGIPINIVPYQRDARVVVTIERGQYIVDSFLKQLDGNQLTIPVKKGYAPNVIVNVMMLQGTQENNSLRQEPRFFAGYAEATIDTAMHELNINLSTDKSTYLPGDQVTIAITTTDSTGKPVDARVSVAVVDEALASLYTLLKEPLPYFFNKVGTSIFTYTNMKLLYQSLKAFATGGAKGGAGNGGKAMFSYIRDDLKDAAFRSGAVYTKGGRAEVTFTAPENLTTWLIDTIGITADTRLGTATTGFVVKKDLIIEPNAPLFVTLGDQLTVPVKVVVPDASKRGEVKGSAWIVNQQGERVDLGAFAVAPNSTVGVDITIPKTRWTSQFVDLYVEGTLGTAKDGIKRTIPLRSEGLISRDSIGTINKEGSHTFTIPPSLTNSLSVRLAQLPTNFIDPIAYYLVRYPYGCTEQLLSSLLPLVALNQLRLQGIFTSSLLSGDTIITDQGLVDISTALRDGVAKLLMHQRQDGGFDYWNGALQGEVTRSIYLLSAYAYSSLQQLRVGVPELVSSLESPITRLEGFLSTYRTVAQEGWYRYLLTKARYLIEFSPDERISLDQIQVNETGYMPLLRYLIAVAQQDTDAITTRRQVATIPTNGDEWSDTSIFFNTVSATAMKLRALIDDPQATQQERSDLLLSLLKQREKSGLWGWTTQTNVQVLLTFDKLATFRKPKKQIACTISVDGNDYEVVVTTGSEGIDLPFSGTGVTVSWACDGALLADVSVSFLPEDLEKTLGSASHVSNMQWSLSNLQAKVGDKVDIVGSFATDLAGEQVAVELFVPSEYKLLEVISSKMPTQDPYGYASPSLPFVVSDPHCHPTHRETRFDRLFLYYEVLQPGVCDITIPALKAYSGTTTIMPMRVREMYKGMINGRKVIVR